MSKCLYFERKRDVRKETSEVLSSITAKREEILKENY